VIAYVINGKKHWITGAGISRLHLIFARVFDEHGEELGIGGFLAVREQSKGLRVGKREQTMGLRGCLRRKSFVKTSRYR
jgi:alkylation response protein AidB-like acyl-CoA dehydrogenase